MNSKGPSDVEAMKRSFLELLKRRGQSHDELPLFEWYVEENEKLMAEMSTEALSSIQAQIDAGMDEINDSALVPIQYFIKRIRYSHVIYAASLGETYLKDAINRLTATLGEKRIKFKLTQLNGPDWARERLYLEGYGEFQISDNLWASFSNINKIRNALAHENGQKREYEKLPGISFDGTTIVVEPDFIKYAIEALRSFMDFVDSKLCVVIDRATVPERIK